MTDGPRGGSAEESVDGTPRTQESVDGAPRTQGTFDGVPRAHIVLRPIGTPLSLGMAGLAIASLVQSGYDLHWIAHGQGMKVGLVLLAVPFFLQFLASVLSFLARDGTTGTALGVLSASWLAIALIHIANKGAHRSGALGLMLLAAAGILVLSALVTVWAKPLPNAVFAVVGIRFLLGGIYELGGPKRSRPPPESPAWSSLDWRATAWWRLTSRASHIAPSSRHSVGVGPAPRCPEPRTPR